MHKQACAEIAPHDLAAAVDVEALNTAAKAVVQSAGSETVTFEHFQKVFVGEFLNNRQLRNKPQPAALLLPPDISTRTLFAELGVEEEVVPPEPEKPEGKDGAEDGEEEEEEEEEEEKGGDSDDEGGEEGEEEKEPEPEKPKEYTRKSMALFELFDTSKSGTVSLPHVVSSIALFKSGYGEEALRFTLGAYDIKGEQAANEAAVWAALQLAVPKELSPQQMSQIRRAWRNADKFGASEEEEEEEADDADEEGEGKAAEPAEEGPVETRVMIDSFMEAVQGDEYLAEALLEAVPIPLEDPETSDAPDGDEDDDE